MQRTKIVDLRTVPINFYHKLSNEDYVDVRAMGLSGNNHYFITNNPPYYTSIKGSTEKLLLRKIVVLKLIKINKKLNKNGIELYLFDFYRPIKVQQFLYNVWLPAYLKKIHPHYTQGDITMELNFYSAKPPISEDEFDRNAPPPHTTGAAMDVTLRFKDTKGLFAAFNGNRVIMA
ncbi:M15 family metallopeptidase domain-containing protein [Pelodictyon phaeoclathratiforme]|jgi:D-alanyl-D-alanine dipeptidase|uniref:Peptidase M15D VanX D-ala-D-ala dipeptidase n=1 Tax=Pelodictyon phaeoclathratiforme (strain DSM 5477 / BU-1) TaxID=324925 RepID=B4SCM4_PELPB|nr:M15 family metallopeptidase [Pelodictyon phaeoclathratiforme]ACF44229.1 peptidase M15D VanX D-ala-D-ala dipeptidase [Pelodictyon phaeoclathratiforme BU-1]